MSPVMLAIDTATPAVTAGVLDGDRCTVLAQRVTVGARAHAERLTPNVVAALADAGLSMADVGAVVVGCGPGPFTGLRVGMATAAAYGHALGVPVYGVCSLDAIGVLTADRADDEVLVVTDARRREVYWARYRGGVRVAGPAVSAPADVEVGAARAVAGSRPHAELFDLPVLDIGYPTPTGLVAAVSDWAADPAPPVPLYLRRPDATMQSEAMRRSGGGGPDATMQSEAMRRSGGGGPDATMQSEAMRRSGGGGPAATMQSEAMRRSGGGGPAATMQSEAMRRSGGGGPAATMQSEAMRSEAPEVSIGALTDGDAARCAELEALLFDADDPWPEAAFRRALRADHHRYLAARVGDLLVGYAGIARLGRTPPFEYEVHTIGVDPAYRGRGIGRRLLNELLSYADGGVVHLEVRTDNAVAIALYRDLGFVEVGLRKRYYQTSGADAYLMRREAT